MDQVVAGTTIRTLLSLPIGSGTTLDKRETVSDALSPRTWKSLELSRSPTFRKWGPAAYSWFNLRMDGEDWMIDNEKQLASCILISV
jgi:hypothetical protein